ncbi:MAG: aminotransferase class III-fold pyridoxal phosphate-dependent enzyme, partial [bacterium]
PVYQAGTLSGNPLAMATGLATLEYLERTDGWRHLESVTNEFVDFLKDKTSNRPVNVPSIGSLFWINLQKEPARRAEDISKDNATRYKELFSRALEAGIYLAPSAYEVGFISTAHSREDLKSAAQTLGEIIRSL